MTAFRETPRGEAIVPTGAPFGDRRVADLGSSRRLWVRSFALDTARAQDRIAVAGDFVALVSGSSPAATVSLRLESPTNSPIPFRRGMALGVPAFSQLYLSHAAQAGESVTLLSGIMGGGFFYTPPHERAADAVNAPSPVTVGTSATQLVAANPKRHAVTLVNWNTAGRFVYIGAADVAASEGHKLPDQFSTLTLETTAALYGIVDSGTAQVGVLEEVES